MEEHFDIFICYRLKESFSMAIHLAERLEKDGYKVSFDKHTIKRGKFDDKLLRRIEKCKDFIIVLNERSFDRTKEEDYKLEEDWVVKELQHAIKYKKNIIPVMMHDFDWPENMPKEISDLKLINGPKIDPDYYDAFYNKLCEDFLITKSAKRETTSLKLTGVLVVAAMLIGLLIGAKFINKSKAYSILNDNDTTSTSQLLIVGGGSVEGYINEQLRKINKSFSLYSNQEWLYIPMPSRQGLNLLREELSRRGAENDKNTKRYDLMVLSSAKLKPEDLTTNKDEKKTFIDKVGYVVEIQLSGKDELKVKASKGHELWKDYENKHEITVEQLSGILEKLKNDSTLFNLYTTTKGNSGTFSQFASNLTMSDSLALLPSNRFMRNSASSFFDSPYMVLCSQYYYPDILGSDNFLTVKKRDGQTLANDLYIYVLAYNNNNVCTIPAKVIEFLKILPDNISLNPTRTSFEGGANHIIYTSDEWNE